MSDTKDKGTSHGLSGLGKQLVIHPAASHLAQSFFRNPTVAAWAHAHPDLAKLAGMGAAGLTGFYDIPYVGPFINEFVEVFTAEGMEILEALAKDTGNVGLQKSLDAAVKKSIDKLSDMGVVIALDQIHKDRDCVVVAGYIADTTPAPRVDHKGGGKVIKLPPTARIIETTLGRGIASRKALCSDCFPRGTQGLQQPVGKKDGDSAHAAPSGRTVGEVYLEWLKTDVAQAKAFFATYSKLDDTMTHKFTLLFAKKGSLELLQAIASHPAAEWSNVLDAMLGPSNRGAEGLVNFLTNAAGDFFKGIEERAKEEGAEGRRFLDGVETGANAIKASLDERNAKAKSRRAHRDRKSNVSVWVWIGGAGLLATIVGWGLFAINHYVR